MLTKFLGHNNVLELEQEVHLPFFERQHRDKLGQHSPKVSQDSAKMGQHRLNMAPRWAKITPRWGNAVPASAKHPPTMQMKHPGAARISSIIWAYVGLC